MSSFDLGRSITRRQVLRAGAGGALSFYGAAALAGCTVGRAVETLRAVSQSSRRSTVIC